MNPDAPDKPLGSGLPERISLPSGDLIVPPARSPEEAEDIRAFIEIMRTTSTECPAAARAGLDALRRLCIAAWTSRTSGQSNRIVRMLASLYNGSDAQRVDLADCLAALDWNLRKDVCAVMLGKGLEGFSDVKIRETFQEVGGDDAVNWFLGYIGEHTIDSLHYLVDWCIEHRESGTARTLRDYLRSLHNGSTKVSLASLGHMDDDITKAFVSVLDGLFGEYQRQLHTEDIAEAFETRGALGWFLEEPAVAPALR